jgi:hypothetical protein
MPFALEGYAVIVFVGAAMGALFGVLVRGQRHGIGEDLFWGMSYGVFWWVLGQLTLGPLIFRGAFTWDLSAAQASFPGFLGFLMYGSLTGLMLGLIRFRTLAAPFASLRVLGWGLMAGLAGAWILGSLLDFQGHLVPMGVMVPGMPQDNQRLAAWIIVLTIGAIAGTIYSALYPTLGDGAGASAIRGAAYGFLWWALGGLTLLPMLSGQGIGWSVDHVRAEFPTFPGFLLFGSILTLFYQWMHGLHRTFFSEEVGKRRFEGPGIQAIRAIGRGAMAGLIGGGVFTLVMLRIGFLPTVASVVGSTSPSAGLLVHFGIAVLIGMSYGLLFRRQSFDVSSALGWGLAYGFLWWILGALTLMPVMLGAPPQWSVSTVAMAFPALVGHLGYGAGLGLTFYLLEARDRPWWLSRSESEAERIDQRKEQILTSAPAIWVLIVMIALMLPVLLGMQ